MGMLHIPIIHFGCQLLLSPLHFINWVNDWDSIKKNPLTSRRNNRLFTSRKFPYKTPVGIEATDDVLPNSRIVPSEKLPDFQPTKIDVRVSSPVQATFDPPRTSACNSCKSFCKRQQTSKNERLQRFKNCITSKTAHLLCKENPANLWDPGSSTHDPRVAAGGAHRFRTKYLSSASRISMILACPKVSTFQKRNNHWSHVGLRRRFLCFVTLPQKLFGSSLL